MYIVSALQGGWAACGLFLIHFCDKLKRRKTKKVHVFYTNRLSYWCKMLCKEPLQRTDNVQYLRRIS